MMTKRIVLAAATAVVALGLGSSTFAQARRQSSASPGDVALAARFAELSRDMLRIGPISEPALRGSSQLLQAAHRLDPTDPRYPRLWAMAELQRRDRLGAIAATKEILKVSPTSIGAQTRLIDLYLMGMESADQKLAYLKDIVGKPPVGDLVRSHAAARAASILLERGETEQAKGMVGQALRLNPLNVEGLRVRYQMVAHDGTPLERVSSMLSLLRANPAQPQVMAALGQQLASIGITDAALQWYVLAGNLGPRTGWPAPAWFLPSYLSELFIGGQLEPAQKITDQILTNNPSSIDLWFLKLTMDKAAGGDSYNQTKDRAGVALTNRIQEIRKTGGISSATTRPVDTPGAKLELPDVAADAAQFQALKTDNASPQYTAALGDIAWYQVYFLEQPVAQPVMDYLRQHLGAENPTVARLEGWSALVQGNADEAKVKLSAVADRDPLAKLGMIRLIGKDAASQDTANAEARKLVSDNPTGVVGAMIWGAFKGNPAVKIVRSQQADAIVDELNKFPKDLLKILDHPQDFYAVRGQPLQISHAFGEPMEIELTIQNLSDIDLTVGPDGIIHPEIWFSARLKGAVDQQLGGVAVDEIAEQGILKARQGVSQIVRIDQGQLSQLLSTNPTASVQVYAGAMTNPIPTREGGLTPGAAGYAVQFPRVMQRQPAGGIGDAERQRIYAALANGTGAEKIRALELLATYVQAIRANKEAPKEAIAITDEMATAVANARGDRSAGVQAWAAYLSALIGPPDHLPDAVKTMLSDKAWEQRMFGLAIIALLKPDQMAQLPAHPAEGDADPLVKAYGAAVMEQRAVAATQPAHTPATKEAAPQP